MPSEYLDNALADPKTQKALVTHKWSRLFHLYLENRIVDEYALLIDVKLREAFKLLTLDEFKSPCGFECKDKSSEAQQYYFKTRNYLEYFIKQDIKQHDNPDAQLNAFRRWVSISEQLLNRHCYEGFLLIIVNLQLIEKKHLVEGLPLSHQKLYKQLCELSDGRKNHSALRNYMNTNKSKQDFFPLLLWHHATGTLNESQNKLHNGVEELTERKDNINKKIAHLKKCHSKHRLHKAKKERSVINKELRAYSLAEKENNYQRKKILREIKAAQKQPLPRIDEAQQRTYEELIERYRKETSELSRRNIPSEPSSSRTIEPSKLYSNKLLPSFWSRKGLSQDKYWEKTLRSDTLVTFE